jgi:hypothetical protein
VIVERIGCQAKRSDGHHDAFDVLARNGRLQVGDVFLDRVGARVLDRPGYDALSIAADAIPTATHAINQKAGTNGTAGA